MSLKKKWSILLIAITVLLLLAACGGSAESKVLGSWKAVGNNLSGYLEINEERYTIRKDSNDNPMTVEYILTETQDDNFIMEAVNPEDGTIEFLFEGFFENKDKIILLGDSDDAEEKSELIRVDSIADEMKKDKKKSEELEEKEAAKEEEEERLREEKNKELAKEEEKRLQAEKDKELAKEEEERLQAEKNKELAVATAENEVRTVEANSLNPYLQKANNLDDGIIIEAKKIMAQDMPLGFYGQYYHEWDDLLNEVWGELKTVLSETEFEKLKSDQNEWIKKKEQGFAEISDEVASERQRGMDYLAFETKDRTYYLIETYLE